MAPDRELAPPLAVTEKDTEPFPEPGEPAVTLIQASVVDAVHWHPDPAVTATEPVAAPEASWALGGFSGLGEKEQPTAAVVKDASAVHAAMAPAELAERTLKNIERARSQTWKHDGMLRH
jgi:hypothetical protein